MPCRTDYMEDPTPPKPNMKDYVKRTDYNQVLAEADLTTRLLCEIMSKDALVFTKENLLRDVKGLQHWWEKHQKQDRERIKANLAARMPLLSDEQMRAIQKILDGGKQ